MSKLKSINIFLNKSVLRPHKIKIKFKFKSVAKYFHFRPKKHEIKL